VNVLDEVEESPCTAVTVTLYACPGALAETKNLEALCGVPGRTLSFPVVSMKQTGEESEPTSWLGVDDIVHGPASSVEKPVPPAKNTGVPAGPLAGDDIVIGV
jgi:hypothetical protein